MKTGVVGVIWLLAAWPGATFAAVEWAPDRPLAQALPGYVFAWAPEGARLAFADGHQLWIAAADDWQGRRRYTSELWLPDAAIEQLVWAPDGNAIAVVAPRREDQWASIWLVDTRGGAVRDLLPPAVSDVFGSPGIRAVRVGTWLGSGSLAFVQRCGTGCLSAHRVAIEPRAYGHYCVAGADGGFHWDPAGAWAMFGGHLGALGFIDLQLPSDDPWRECGTAFPSYDPRTSAGEWYAFETAAPDGRQVLLRRHTDQAHATGLAVWDLQGLPTDLLSGAVLAAWSPDSRRIAFVKLGKPSRAASETLDAELALLEWTGGVRVLAPLGRVDAGQIHGDWLMRPTWSPDGGSLVAQDLSGRVWLLQPDTSLPPRRLLTGEAARAAWSADSQWLVLQVADAGVPEIGTPHLLRVGGVEP